MNGQRAVVCEHCFKDNHLREWIREYNIRENCPWCGSENTYVAPLIDVTPLFREVASIYKETAYPHGDLIDYLLQQDWNIFSEDIENAPGNLMHDMTIEILKAGITKDDVDLPDYEGLFQMKEPWLENSWHEKMQRILTGEEDASIIKPENDLGDPLEFACEELAVSYEEGQVLYRARIHEERSRSEKYIPNELSAPSPAKARAARANRAGEPVLYLASDLETALSEVRAWRGAAVAIARVKIIRRLEIINLLDLEFPESPFFEEHFEWKIELAGLFHRFAEELSRPVIPGEEERLYIPSQHLCDLFQASRYDGVAYPSAMGTGHNLVLFNPSDAEPLNVTYYRIQGVTYDFNELGMHEEIYEEWPYE